MAQGAGRNEPSALWGATVIRTFLLEEQLKSGDRSASDYDRLQSNVDAALAHSPTDSFTWLVAFWLRRLRFEPTANDSRLLRMSYWSGPNEAWIAVRRNPVALGVFPSLPDDLADQALSEFVRLLRSRLYTEASNILAGPGWAIREQLLSRLSQVDEVDRRGFARALRSKDLDGVTVPGVDERPSRPF